MPRIVISGGPGAGKTTLLGVLAALGYTTVEESARTIIAERLAAGHSRRPEPLTFAREVLRRDIEKYLRSTETTDWVFFDRGVVEALGLLHEASPFAADELAAMLTAYPFHQPVFILPPWKAIYAMDAERDHTFAEAVDVHTKVVKWYRSCGYGIREVPRLPAKQRAAYVLRILGAGDV
jgi:predicted ATPase